MSETDLKQLITTQLIYLLRLFLFLCKVQSKIMAWIKTLKFEEADEKLQKIMTDLRMTYPKEYATPAPTASTINESIVDSHTLIPDALHHAFMTFSVLMSPELPLERRQQEMIATVVSATNDCFY